MQRENDKNYEAVIGLEIHAELKTKSKMFCSCANQARTETCPTRTYADIKPNENVCPVCLGMPGTLPVINKKAVEWTILTGLALNCKVNKFTKWDRKNYFYPDLPKGYQISQFDLPLVYGGYLEISNSQFPISNKFSNFNDQKIKKIRITRIHLEEDTGTSKHPEGRADVDYSLLDFNRAGVPLMELVTEPDLRNAKESKQFCQKYQQILRTLKVSDADMEKGQMRCEANISIRKSYKSAPLGTKVEVKNLNSFKSVERAIEYEIKRQTEVLEFGEKVVQETRGWDEKKQKTYVMRIKETSADYRYFPEPDLPPLQMQNAKCKMQNDKSKSENSINIEEIRKQLPELPKDRAERYQKEYKLSIDDAMVIASDSDKAEYFEKLVTSNPSSRAKLTTGQSKRPSNSTGRQVTSKKHITNRYSQFANWMINEIPNLDVEPKYLVELINLINEGKISGKIVKEMLPEIKKGISPSEIIKEKGMEQISDKSKIESIVDKIIKDNPDAVKKIKSGQTGVMGFLVGQVMRETKGKANPKMVNEILRKRIS